ncbi:PilZ domain-containing protein [Sphingomonas sp. R86521]|uniref:PilZ domain-containing protein n=1 Tax=Sphingomonas sp. R86521 TaxID=3093860 RepID=UPI0036D292BB
MRRIFTKTAEVFSPRITDRRSIRRRRAGVPCWIGSSALGKRRAELRDISAQGCLCMASLTAQPGTSVLVTIPTFGPMLTTVRWARVDRVGLEFANPLHASVVEHIVKAHPPVPIDH